MYRLHEGKNQVEEKSNSGRKKKVFLSIPLKIIVKIKVCSDDMF